ncbi:MAG: hypothetical protein N2Z70_04050 [Bdellovibrionaceae bacterium]|nr:hypothetical protein [Pseudobdellovibrionaceae bacterium]
MTLLLGVIRVLLRWSLGFYFFVQGLNGFFSFFPLPPPTEKMRQFLEVFFGVPGFAFMVKAGEMGIGLALISGWALGVSLLLLGVLVYGICVLQWFFMSNRKLSLGLGLWYGMTLLLHSREMLQLLVP